MKSKIYLSLFLASVVLSAQPTTVGTATIKQNPATEKVQPVQLPVLEKKNPQKQYEAVIKMLESKESTKAQRAYEDQKAQKLADELKQKEFEKEAKEREKKELEEFKEMLLPIPVGSIVMDNQLFVFAEYREKRLKDDISEEYIETTSETNTGSSATAGVDGAAQTTNNNSIGNINQAKANGNAQTSEARSGITKEKMIKAQSKVDYPSKTIIIKEGDVFDAWSIKKLTSNYIEYENKSDKLKIIKKYY